MPSHIQDFGLVVNTRFTELNAREDAHERLNGLVAFYHGLTAIEEHANLVGNQLGCKKASLDLLRIVERIKRPVFQQVEDAQITVYRLEAEQLKMPF